MSKDNLIASDQQVLRTLCDDLMGLVGKQFFSALMTKLAHLAGADYAFIGQFLPGNHEIVRTVAVYADGKNIENLDFPIKNTPCDVVVKEGFKHYPHGVIELFPLDHLAIEMKVDSYVGIPLVNSNGVVIGPLAVFSRNPLHNQDMLETVLHMVALRASAEMERLAGEARRQEELYFLQSLLDAIPNPVFYKDVTGKYLGCNKSYETLSGISRDNLVDRNANELIPKERAAAAIVEDEKVFATKKATTYASEVVCADGTSLNVLYNKAPFFDSSGEIGGLVGTIQDVTSLKEMESAIQGLIESTVGYTGAECYHRIASALCHWFDADCAIVAQLLGDGTLSLLAKVKDGVLITREPLCMKGTPCEKVITDGACLFEDGLQEHFPDNALVNELEAQGYAGMPVHSHTGEIIGVLSVLSRQPIKRMERAEDVLTIMASRVSAELEREQSEQRLRENETHLEFLAYHDVLTELPNRQLFRDRLQHAISRASLSGSQVAVLFLDLDRFKKINDSLGHELGDQLLCEVANRLKRCAGDVDTVARLSGDEFAIIVDHVVGVENVIVIVEQIRKALSDVITIEDYKLFVTASIGVSLYPRDGETVVALLKGADAAMFEAKDLGRDNYRFYTAGLNERAGELLMLESALREAVELNRLVVYYQPQVDMINNTVVGLEALVRWIHPEQGIISPADFIPLAEETGLIVPLGEWVLHQACVQGREWQRNGYPKLNISVNMSARQFGQKNIVDVVKNILEKTGFSAEYLDLEITESVLMNDVDGAIDTMSKLQQLGVRLSIDDFGTGFSSLAYLKRFPIDTLKIDQSFVRDIVSNSNDAAIATTIVDLARNMNLGVIAEGVEHEEQRDYLQSHGCRLGQGYLFSKPLPPDAIEKKLKRAIS
ncbi:MAG: hypothetical protein B6I36_07570 [Desulfobacteraceae bacterium 4572_35.1]|nr:MAG: hypothetical protein B6I36_07570 [Desulfobacteraceae bacterium 4572_35.1]